MRTRGQYAGVFACVAVVASGCVTVSESNPTPPLARPQRTSAAAPEKVVVSPLTRVGIDTGGEQTIFLHLDFRDAGEKSIKAFGQLRVELYEGATTTDGAATPARPIARSWDADLADPVRNALSFDEMITRTYTINLGGLPEWLVHWARRENDQPAPLLVVQFAPEGSSGGSQIIRATYTLTR